MTPPREMAIELAWQGDRVQILLINGDKTLHSDYCDPRSDVSRKRALDKLRERFSALDLTAAESQLLEMARTGPTPVAAKAGATLAVGEDPEPWPEPVDGSALLDEIVALLRRFVVLPVYAAEIVALWALHTFCFQQFEYSPRLVINSPEKRCGKSRLMRLMAALIRRPLACENISTAALFRVIDKFRCSMLLDEADTYLSGRNANEELRGVINAGHQRGGTVFRCSGDENEPVGFDVFGPLAIALIGKPPGTVEDRSIRIAMRRKTRGERVERFPPGVSLRTVHIDLVRRCLRWANDNAEALSRCVPKIPPALDDRAADSWYALLAIADLAGGPWPARARDVAAGSMAARESDSQSTLLLSDIRDLFNRVGADRLTSDDLCRQLAKLEGRPWADLDDGDAITPNQLARLLRPFEVRPCNLRQPNDSVLKGYYRSAFEDAWSRYLHDPTDEAATPLHGRDDNDLRADRPATGGGPVADENSRKSASDKGCSGVADETPPPPGEEERDVDDADEGGAK